MAHVQARRGMTIAELRRLPASIDLETAGRALGVGRTKAHELVRAGEFPARVMRLGRAYRVVTADVLTLLGVDEPQMPQQATA